MFVKILTKEYKGEKRYYKQKIMINRNVSICILKDELIHVILEKDPAEQAKRMEAIYDELSRNVVPIRDNRHHHRTKGVLTGKS